MINSEVVVGLRHAGARPRELRTLLDSEMSLSDWESLTLDERREAGLPVLPPVSLILPQDVWVMTWQDADYPEALRHVAAPPAFLLGLGDRAALSLGVAVVGTREITALGAFAARCGAEGAALAGAPAHSGLARGVDAAAHAAALDLGVVTCGVLGGGIDQITPRSNAALAQKMLESGGAVVSELLPGVPVRGPSLQARNRIVAGLSSVVVVAECGLASGTMGTVRSALAMGRPLVVPRLKAGAPVPPGSAALGYLADPDPDLSLLQVPKSLQSRLVPPLATAASSSDFASTVARLHGEFSLSTPSTPETATLF